MAKSGTSESDVDEKKVGAGGDSASNQNNDNDEQSQEEASADQAMYVVAKPNRTTAPVSILIESLVQKLCLLYEPDSKNALKIYNFICERLFEMNMLDESYKMAEFEGMRNQYQRAFHQLLTTAQGGEKSIPLRPTWDYQEFYKEFSRYFREFDEVEYIAGGGFGQVFKVKHKLDGTEYAIKKIVIRSEGIKSVMNYLSEVKTFASLNQANIVQYKAAWIELGAPTGNLVTQEDSESDYSYSVQSRSTKPTKCSRGNVDKFVFNEFMSEIEDSSIHLTKDGTSTDFEVSFINSSDYKSKHHSLTSNVNSFSVKHTRTKRSSTSEGGNAICTIEEIKNLQIRARPASKWATLYIQMSLCQLTLKQWLERRNSAEATEGALVPMNNAAWTPRRQTILEILKQILKGLEYIHSKNIVHHDIKPSNIFMEIENGSLLVQLGDFGLACPLQSARHSLAFGTRIYAAPEQLDGRCDPKSDMYSLGIILFELVSHFDTDMERIHNITKLRKGQYKDLDREFPTFAPIITSLMAKYPEDRPSATSLIERITTKEEESEIIQELRNQLNAKDEEIKRLKELLQLKDKGHDT